MTVPPPSLPSSSSSSTTLQPPGSFQNTSAGQQRPTLTNIHIRSVDDAKKLFYAVQLGMLPKVERRLDAQERRMLRPGNVYVWEEKGPSGGENGYQVCIERWTEGLSWSASRIRDDFLMYYENRKKKSDKDSDGGGGSGRARSLENEVLRDGERDLYVKQTYSVHRNDVSDDTIGVGLIASGSTSGKESEGMSGEGKKEKRKPRKWHLNAYFTKSTEGNLNTIDSIPYLRDLVVPEGIFSSARQTKKSSSSSTSTSTPTSNIPSAKPDSSVPPDESGNSAITTTTRKRGREGTSVQRTYAPFPVGDRGLKPAPPPPPPTVVPHLRNQHPPPPPPVPPQQWHHHHQQQSYEQDLGSGAFDRFGSAYASPPPPPPPPSYLYGPTNNSYVVSSPVSGSVYAPSPSSSHTNGNGVGNGGGQSTTFEFAEYGYAGPSQTFGGAIHHPQHPQHALPPHQQHQQHQNQHQQQQYGQTFRQHHETSPLGSDSPVLSEFGSGGSGSGGSGGSTSWHTPSPRPEMGLGVGVGVGLGGSMSMLGGGGGGVDGLGVGGAGEEDLSGYMPMPPLRYSPDADVALPPPPPSASSSSLNHANDDMRMMSLGDSSSRYGRPPTSSHMHTRTHSNNDLTFVATTINPDFLAGVTNNSNTNANGPLTPTFEPTTRRDRSRSTSSNSPFRRRPIQLPQLNVPNTDLSTGGAVEYFESDLSTNAAYAWDSEDYGNGSTGGDGVGGGGGGGGGGAQRVALAPLHSLQRNHPYRRNPVDDRQLRMLGPGAR